MHCYLLYAESPGGGFHFLCEEEAVSNAKKKRTKTYEMVTHRTKIKKRMTKKSNEPKIERKKDSCVLACLQGKDVVRGYPRNVLSSRVLSGEECQSCFPRYHLPQQRQPVQEQQTAKVSSSDEEKEGGGGRGRGVQRDLAKVDGKARRLSCDGREGGGGVQRA